MTTAQERRMASVRAVVGHESSQRRACCLVDVDPKTVRRVPELGNPEIRGQMLDARDLL